MPRPVIPPPIDVSIAVDVQEGKTEEWGQHFSIELGLGDVAVAMASKR